MNESIVKLVDEQLKHKLQYFVDLQIKQQVKQLVDAAVKEFTGKLGS